MRPPTARDRLATLLTAQQQKTNGIRETEPSPQSEADRQALRARGHRIIEEGLRRLGAAEPAALLDEMGFAHFPLGSIRCTLGIVALESRDLFLVYAPIMDLPSDRDLLLPLYRLLLELNNEFELSIAKFGLHGDTLYLSAMRPLAGLDAEEVEDMARWVACRADGIDDRLLADFGGASKQRRRLNRGRDS